MCGTDESFTIEMQFSWAFMIFACMAQEFMHKNKLQEYAQRCAIALPIYHTINEGSPHAPEFRSTVTVDGTMFTSALTFANKKAAEQDVAKYALEGIVNNIKKNGIPLIHQDTIFCKSILHEYAVKMNLKLPTYETSQQPGNFPVYSSSVLFDDKTFKGGFEKSKKKAEQIGARTVIEFILGNSDTSTLMTQIINSKVRLYTTMHKGAGAFASQIQNVVTFAPNTTENNDKLMGSQVSLNCNVPCDVTPPRPLCSDRNTVASDSLPAEATRDQTCKQGTDIITGNTSLILVETVRDGRSANVLSENDSGALHIKHPVEVTVKVASDDFPSSCGNSQGHVPDASNKRNREEQTSNSELKKARVDEQKQSQRSAT